MLKASRAEELIKKRHFKFARLPTAVWVTRQSQLKSSEREAVEERIDKERRRKERGRGTSSTGKRRKNSVFIKLTCSRLEN